MGELPSSVRVDFDAEVSSTLFCVRGNIMVPGNGSIPYLLLNATLSQGGLALQSTKYLLMDVEPGGDHGFEISKNMKISPGNYNCTLDVAGPKGSLVCETRRCKSPIPWTEPCPADKRAASLSPETALKKAGQRMEEEMIRNAGDRVEVIRDEEDREEVIQGAEGGEESGLEKDAHEEAVVGRSGNESRPAEKAEEIRDVSKTSSEAPTREEDLQAENISQENDSSSKVGASLKASSTLSSGQKETFVGSSTSKKYHRLDCRYAAKIKPENRIYFAGEEEARQQGYLPCKVCNP